MTWLYWKTERIILVVLLLSFLLGAWAWQKMPEQVPSHYNMNGEVDGHSGKFAGLFMMPIINLVLYLFMLVIPYMDLEKARQPGFAFLYFAIRMLTHIFMATVHAAMILTTLQPDIDMGLLLPLLMGLFFAALGFIMQLAAKRQASGIISWNQNSLSPGANRKLSFAVARMTMFSGLLLLFSAPFKLPYLFIGIIIAYSVITVGYVFTIIFREYSKQ